MNKSILNYLFLFAILFLIIYGIKTHNDYNRYTIIETNLDVILLDKQQGFAWRQVHIDDKGPAAYWEEMKFYGSLEDNVCKGKEKLHKELQKKLLKEN